MITFDEMTRYILMLKEEAMENNYKLSDAQITLTKKVNTALKNNPKLKEKQDKMLNAGSLSEMHMIWYGRKNAIVEEKEDIIQIPVVENTEVSIEQQEKGRQYTLVNNKKAGFADALIMALVTGFVSGSFTTILLLMIK